MEYTDKDMWVDRVVMPDRATPVEGGPPEWSLDGRLIGGYANVPSAMLADRTRWLKNALERIPVNNFPSGVITGQVLKWNSDSNSWVIGEDNNTTYVPATEDTDGLMSAADKIKLDSIPSTGVAALGTDGKVLSSQLPSYVDDVLEFPSLSSFPIDGEESKIYVALDTNLIYRWSGSVYIQVNSSVSTADDATKLSTARLINGTLFDGTTDITTQKWGAVKQVSIGRTAKAVDGSSDFSYSLNEILPLGSSNQVIKFNGVNWVSGVLEKSDLPQISATKTEMLSGVDGVYLAGQTYLNTITWSTGSYGSGTVTLDLDSSLNHNLTITGSVMVGAPLNADSGKTGDIVLSLTTNAVVSWHSSWKFLSKVPNIGSANELWVVSYKVLDSSRILACGVKAV